LFRLILENNAENMGRKYQDVGTNIISKLKWEIKKFNQETANQYK